MAHNTTLMINHDCLAVIEQHPDEFIKELIQAILNPNKVINPRFGTQVMVTAHESKPQVYYSYANLILDMSGTGIDRLSPTLLTYFEESLSWAEKELKQTRKRVNDLKKARTKE